MHKEEIEEIKNAQFLGTLARLLYSGFAILLAGLSFGFLYWINLIIALFFVGAALRCYLHYQARISFLIRISKNWEEEEDRKISERHKREEEPEEKL